MWVNFHGDNEAMLQWSRQEDMNFWMELKSSGLKVAKKLQRTKFEAIPSIMPGSPQFDPFHQVKNRRNGEYF